jgi:hypothetical protein
MDGHNLVPVLSTNLGIVEAPFVIVVDLPLMLIEGAVYDRGGTRR